MKKDNYIIYALVNPKTKEIFYVGLTKLLLRDRQSGHRCEARKNNTEKSRVIKSLNYEFDIIQLESIVCHKPEALKREKRHISRLLKKGHILCNSVVRIHAYVRPIASRKITKKIADALSNGGFSTLEIAALMGYKSPSTVFELLKK